MSYIIAFVSFFESTKEYPVQCFRTDIQSQDDVVIKKQNGELKLATVKHLEYLNWECHSQIECKRTECTIEPNGRIILPKSSPINFGIATPYAFVKELKSMGWIPIKHHHRMYRATLAYINSSSVAYIFVRKNGVDIQIMPKNNIDEIKPYSFYENSFNEGKLVRHSLAHTTFNLFEGILRFSKSFLNNEEDLDRYFVPQGEKDKRTEKLKSLAREQKSSRNEMRDIYEACSGGGGGPAYLGDGIWLTSDGDSHDWGR